jgi:hypothetical protein
MPQYPFIDAGSIADTSSDLPPTHLPGALYVVLSPLSLWAYKAGVWTQVATPANQAISAASEFTSGIVTLASQTETDLGVNDTKAVTPLKLRSAVLTALRIFDDFISGSVISGEVGSLGWQFTTIVANLASSAGRVGVIAVDSSAVSGTYSVMYVRSQPTIGVVVGSDTFDLTFALRLQQTDADTLVRFGMGNDATANPPANGIYIEKLAADTQFFGVTRSGGVESRTAALATADTSWHKFRIRRLDATTISFSIDGGVQTATANIPTTHLQPFVAIRSNTTTQKRIEVDYVDLQVTGLVR